MEVSPKPRGEEKRGDLTKVRDEKVQCMCVREGEMGTGVWWPTLHFCATSSPGYLRALFSTSV